MINACVVTGTRAEYGLLKGLMIEIQQSKKTNLQLIVTGTHLSRKYGNTIQEIEVDGFKINKKVPMMPSSDSVKDVTKSMGKAIIGYADALSELNPDILILLGDRYEILAAASSALLLNIPICHIHGGEITEGAFDDSIRHAITKMSKIHFVASEDYRNRVIQLGEEPRNVFNVGGLGVDAIKKFKPLSIQDLELKLRLKFKKNNLLVTFHPVTHELNTASNQIHQLLKALGELENTNLIFTMPNADPKGEFIWDAIQQFVKKDPSMRFAFKSLGSLQYFSTLSYVDGVIGNSSSGVLEAPSFKIGTVNIGSRQQGRLMSNSVINCKPECKMILKSIKKLYSKPFQKSLEDAYNPYGNGGAAKKIIKILNSLECAPQSKKKFYDMKINYDK